MNRTLSLTLVDSAELLFFRLYVRAFIQVADVLSDEEVKTLAKQVSERVLAKLWQEMALAVLDKIDEKKTAAHSN